MNIEHPASELNTELVFGDEPIDDEHLEALRREVAQLRADYAAAPAPEPSEDLARFFEPDPQNAPAAVVPLRSGTSAGRRPVRLTRRLAIAVAAVVGAAALTTGLAAADVLPGPVQQAVHDVLSHVGVNVPTTGTDDHPVSPPPAVPGTDATGATPTSSASGTPPGAAPGGGAPAGGVPNAAPLPGTSAPLGLPPASALPTVPTVPVTVPNAGSLLPPLNSLPLPLPPVLAPTTTSPKPSGSTTQTTTRPPTPPTTPALPLPPLPPLPPPTLPHLPPLLP